MGQGWGHRGEGTTWDTGSKHFISSREGRGARVGYQEEKERRGPREGRDLWCGSNLP